MSRLVNRRAYQNGWMDLAEREMLESGLQTVTINPTVSTQSIIVDPSLMAVESNAHPIKMNDPFEIQTVSVERLCFNDSLCTTSRHLSVSCILKVLRLTDISIWSTGVVSHSAAVSSYVLYRLISHSDEKLCHKLLECRTVLKMERIFIERLYFRRF